MGGLFIAALSISVGSGALAQHTPTTCQRTATTRIVFGLEGGNMRPARTTIEANGAVTRSRDTLSAPERLPRVDTSVVRAVARTAWAGAVTPHSLNPHTTLANRDAAHPFIEIASACGSRRADYRQGEAPARFRTLFARLTSVAK